MPNMKGGKKYKSSKHSEGGADMHDIGEGQTIGRVIRVLGNRNMLVFCNDNKERLAHIRGGLRKKEACIEVGDIVLVSLRGDGMRLCDESNGDTKDKSDILAKYEREVHGQLKKVPGVNRKLFLQLEKMDERSRTAPMTAEEEDFGFVFEHDSDEDDGEGDLDEEGKDKEEIAKVREARKKASEKKLKDARNAKESGEGAKEKGDDIDIDAI
jgi:translation initiation factor 1A